jgi:hypothetical protein
VGGFFYFAQKNTAYLAAMKSFGKERTPAVAGRGVVLFVNISGINWQLHLDTMFYISYNKIKN